LKAKYGKDLNFLGGGVDTQDTMPYGTPEKVREEVLRNCEILALDGGFVFNTVHNLQADVSLANMAAMIDAIKEYNK
jgi:uroporphyrinogen-III decarboxylase